MRQGKLLGKFGMVVIGIWLLSLYGFDKAGGAEWRLFQATPMGNIYYFDTTSIKHFPNGLVWVWIKLIETKGFSEEELKGLKDSKKAKDIVKKKTQEKSREEWKQLFEINCSARMVRTLSATLYNIDGNIKEDYELPSEWVYIPPDSVTNHLTKVICP